jgi:23S rRNA pseudouridine2605 synthase
MSESPESIKVHAYIAKLGVTSRRKAEELIAAGKVLVNSKPAHIGQRIVPGLDKVVVEGVALDEPQKLRYFIVNKPRGVVSTTSDEEGRRAVTSLLPKNVSERLFPVGRLDMDSEGLILLTNDGPLTQRLTHPSYAVEKTYEVLVDRRPTSKALQHLRSGVKLKEGFTRPAEVEIVGEETNDNTWLSITISEGRNHQVRRMLERVGYDTLRLIRVQMGTLDIGMLEDALVKELSDEEVAELLASIR